MKLQRELGTLPVTIGTAVAIEYLVANPQVLPEEVWINTRTIFRNLWTSLDKEVRETATTEVVSKEVYDEVMNIANILEYNSGNGCRVVFYYCDYADITKQFEHAVLKQPRTDRQKREVSFEDDAMAYLRKQDHDLFDFREFRTSIRGKDTKAWMITHLPVDLLSRRWFAELTLLETHTGVLKPPTQWNTKLTKGKELIRLPFNELTIQLFGDGNKFFTGFPIKDKKEIYQLATDRKWSTLTTRAKIREDLKHLNNPTLKDICLEMLSRRVK